MRKLTVNRKNHFAGAWSSVMIYVSAANLDFPVINKQCHQFLGKLKNGQSVSGEIPEGEVTVLAGYDNLGVCTLTDYIRLPSGTQDIVLNGKTKLNPLMGNPFYFEKIINEVDI